MADERGHDHVQLTDSPSSAVRDDGLQIKEYMRGRWKNTETNHRRDLSVKQRHSGDGSNFGKVLHQEIRVERKEVKREMARHTLFGAL